MDSISEHVIDQIALEGLDGITIPTLWLRLQQPEVEFSLKLTPSLKNIILAFLCTHEHLNFYTLPQPRKEPQIFIRFPKEPAIGNHIATAPDELGILDDVYPVSLVNDAENFIKGSCSDYQTRADVTEEVRNITFKDNPMIEEYFSLNYGLKNLVIVASQKMRENSLLKGTQNLHPGVLSNLTIVQYCILERLGRARCQGELQVVLDQVTFKNSKTYHIHYVMRALAQLDLVSRRLYSYTAQPQGKTNSPQVLLHHIRFSKSPFAQYESMQQKSYNILNESPDKTLLLKDLKTRLGLYDDVDFRKLYRLLCKAKKEISMSILGKGDFFEMRTLTYVGKSKLDGDIDDDESPVPSENKNLLIVEHPFALQAYHYILECAENGVTTKGLLKCFTGYGSLEARNMHRLLEKNGLTKTILEDHGKQRLQKYIPSNLTTLNEVSKQFLESKKRMKCLVLASCMQKNALLQKSEEEISTGHSETPFISNIKKVDDHIDSSVSDSPNENSLVVSNPDIADSESSNDLAKSQFFKDKKTYSVKRWDANITNKNLCRRNIILAHINEVKVVEGIYRLFRVIADEERLNNISGVIDRKTVRRLVNKMDEEGLIKLLKVPLVVNKKTENFWFIASVSSTEKEVEHAITQTKFRIDSEMDKEVARRERAEEIKVRRQEKILLKEQRELFKNGLLDSEDSPDFSSLVKLPIDMGIQPKFIKCKILHRFLWFLTNWTEEKKEEVLAGKCGDEKLAEDEIKWRKYINPLPTHPNPTLHRWLNFGDILAILPINIICKIHKLYRYANEFTELLRDEAKQFTPLSRLPENLQQTVVYKRRHVFAIFKVIEQLAYMGLLSIGPGGRKSGSVLKRKEFEVVYLHSNVSILDTRSSSKSYRKITDKDYDRRIYTINSVVECEQYWQDLKKICLTTLLGFKSDTFDRGTGHLSEVMLKEFVLHHVSRPISSEHLVSSNIPGDGLGAGGLDSSMFSHIFRNWSCGNAGKRRSILNNLPMNEDEPSSKKRKVKSNILDNENSEKHDTNTTADNTERLTVQIVNNVGRNDRVKGGKGKKRVKTNQKQNTEAPPVKQIKILAEPVKTAMCKIGQTKKKAKYTDKKDLEALQRRNGRIRGSFSTAEDALLVLCKVASTILLKQYKIKGRHHKHHLVPWVFVRDILMKKLPDHAMDKTSYSCGRRTIFLMRNRETETCHNVCVLEATKDKAITEKLYNDEDKALNMDHLREKYENLVDILISKFEEQPGLYCTIIPNTISELNELYTVTVIYPATSDKRESNLAISKSSNKRIVKTEYDIMKYVMENLILCSLSCRNYSAPSTTFQLHKIFENFGSSEVHAGLVELQKRAIVTTKLEQNQREFIVPFIVPTYRFSARFDRIFAGFLSNIAEGDILQLSQISPQFNCEFYCKLDKLLVMCNSIINRSGEIEITIPNNVVSYSFDGSEKVEDKEENNESADNAGYSVSSDVSKECAPSWMINNTSLVLSAQNKKKMGGVSTVRHYDNIKLSPCKIQCRNYLESNVEETFNPDVLDDLKSNVFIPIDLKSWCDEYVLKFPDRTEATTLILQFLDNAGSFGLVPLTLKIALMKKCYTNNFDAIIGGMIKEKVVYEVGISEAVVVLCTHAKMWFVRGIKFDETNPEFQRYLQLDKKYKRNRFDAKNDTNSKTNTSNEVFIQPTSDWKHEEILFRCHPWNTVGGNINKQVATRMLSGVFLCIYTNPGIILDKIEKYFSPVLQKVTLTSMLKCLCAAGCIERHILTQKKPTRLFQRKPYKDTEKTVEYFEPTQKSEFKFSEIILYINKTFL